MSANTVYLLRLRTCGNGSILGLYVSSSGKLGYRNDVAGASRISATTVTLRTWHEVLVPLLINGTAGETELTCDGIRVDNLS